MSMLAERECRKQRPDSGRRKQKWAVDPQNTAWSNDDSKFGQRMLEKMGWSKGKGLGAQEQGATDHIKVQVKNNHLGLGATINHEDNWIAHQDDFNQLLAELNTCHGQETADSSDKKEKKSFSLEEKSKISKNRVHYMKFTKGKDLSSRSRTDLDCIFGKRQSKKTLEDDASPSTPDENKTTTTSAFTIQEYFAKRMAALKNKPQVPVPGSDTSETQVERKRGKKRNKEATGEDVESYPQPKAKRRMEGKPERAKAQERVAKKSRPAEEQLRGPCWDQSSEASAPDAGDHAQPPEGGDFTLKPKKRRGKKKPQKAVEIAEDATPEETPVKKKKKKKKKKDSK
ncbi:PREDICTED: PIN2/TERF1-interacting telomerase inhibitor 1 isoform X1 [Colobus angolensis palliatus]|uniref:PIN2/TERF1-interacting telomerase inhibitor 1 isoform X1 n=1 Tax=Colobus angolensis palliatus TaxID=336983 RepID=UPI0005F4E65B|nr:PREDICTED: PIN2/TERF1-interacting telomerase inhibitor 1 isoform X1 [Colobus angolensis palliatus]